MSDQPMTDALPAFDAEFLREYGDRTIGAVCIHDVLAYRREWCAHVDALRARVEEAEAAAKWEAEQHDRLLNEGRIAEARIAELEAGIGRLHTPGCMLANMAFNLAQTGNLDDHGRSLLETWRREWDAALRELPADLLRGEGEGAG